MQPVIIVLVVLAVLGLLLLFKAVHVVPQATAAAVERFGRYRRTLQAGFRVVVPFVDSIRTRVDLREQVVPFPPQPVVTRDNLVVSIDVVVYYQVTDVRAATYEVASYLMAIEQLMFTTLRNLIGGMDLDRTLASREQFNERLRGVLDEATAKWGIRINLVELKAMEPPASVREAMEEQLRADRDRRAAILRAEGEKQAALLKAETEREVAAILDRGPAAERSAPTTPYVPSQLPARNLPLGPDDPRRIGRYQLTARLGQGGMGTVYLGRSPGERLVAVKVIQANFAADPVFRRRFGREIEAARRVGGFHTAPVVDADPHGDPPWLATEYIPGPTLHEVLRQQGALPTRTLHTLAVGIAEALEGIHACDIVHRDLKPGNIIVSGSGPRVIDFGIARALDGTVLTRTDHVVGTHGFLAPEQLTGGAVTPATDLYAFGMVLCHTAGAAPFAEGESLQSALALLPSRLGDLVARCLDHDPARRPTPTDVLDLLSGNDAPSDDWLPPPVRTMVDLHDAATASAPGAP